MSPASLSDLPTELLLLIVNYLEYSSEINNLSTSCRRVYQILATVLYTKDAKCERYALRWAATVGNEHTARKTLDAGAELTPELAATAVHYNHEPLVKLFYEQGVDINAELDSKKMALYTGCDHLTALNAAARSSTASMVRLLWSLGATTDNPLPDPALKGRSVPLISAARGGNLATTRLLLDADTPVDYTDDEDITALYHAARKGHLELVKLLLERGANPALGSDWLSSGPLSMAIEWGHTEVALVLLNHGAPPTDWLMLESAFCGYSAVLDTMLRRLGFPRAAKDPEELNRVTCYAASCGAINLVIEALALGWDVNHPPFEEQYQDEQLATTALAWAVDEGHGDIVRLLLSHGADPNVHTLDTGYYRKIMSPLYQSVCRGQEEVFQLLLDHGARITNGRELLVESVRQRSTFIFGRLRDLGVECDGYLFAESRYSNAESCQFLINRGISFNDHKRDETYEYLLEVEPEQDEKLDILLANGFDPRPGRDWDEEFIRPALWNPRNNARLLKVLRDNGFTFRDQSGLESDMLAQAAMRENPDIARKKVDTLLQQGLEIDMVDARGESPLFYAIDHTQLHHRNDAARILLERGANPCFQIGGNGRSVLDVVLNYQGQGPSLELIETIIPYIDRDDKILFSVAGPQLLRVLSALKPPRTQQQHRVRKLVHNCYWNKWNSLET